MGLFSKSQKKETVERVKENASEPLQINESKNERDLVEKYAPHACCLAMLFSATFVCLTIYGIYKLIMMLL